MKEDFKKDLKIKTDEEKNRLLELQSKFKNGEIFEEDINHDDYEKLLRLYDEQNNELKAKLELYKNKSIDLLNKLKK